jgi:hypothetical protein
MFSNCSTVPRTTRVVAVGAATLVALAACAGSTTKRAVSGPSPLRSATTGATAGVHTNAATTSAFASRQIVSAVSSFWDLYLQLGGARGPFNRVETRLRLRQRAAGAELRRLSDVLEANAAAGLVVEGTVDIAPRVVSIVGTTALVRDCFDDNTGLYRVSDGQRLDTNDPRRHRVLITLTDTAGMWKVSAMQDEGLGCAA